jgi:signal transduction histidine kinase
MEKTKQRWEGQIAQKEAVTFFLDDSQAIHPALLYNDDNRISQVLDNLIDNALKYTDKGYIRFGYEPTDDPSELLFFVEDTGAGIPKEQHGIIFVCFRQSIDTELKLRGGTGLGLSVSKGMVEQMGGRIWVESEEGQGSTFFFTVKKQLSDT